MPPTDDHVQALRAEVRRLALGASFDLPRGLYLQGPLASAEFAFVPAADEGDLWFRIRPSAPRAAPSPGRLAGAAATAEALAEDSDVVRRLARSSQRRLTSPPVRDEDLAGCRLTLRLTTPEGEQTELDAETASGGAASFGRVPARGRCEVIAASFGVEMPSVPERLADTRPEVRLAGLEALAEAGPTAAGEAALAELLERPASDRLKAAALAVLARWGRLPGEQVAWLLGRLEDADAGVRRAATTALMRCPAATRPDVLRQLIERLGDTDAGVRSVAASAVIAAGPAALPALASRVDDRNPLLRRAAAEAIGRAGADPVAGRLEALFRLLGDTDSTVVRASVVALGRLAASARPEHLAAVTSLLGHSDRGVRAAAARACSQLGSLTPDTVSAVSGLLDDPDGSVRLAARAAMAAFGDEPLRSGPFAGRFEIVAVLGRGGMGTVFHARRTDGGEEVALKVPLPPYDHGEGRRRFREEARIGGLLCHPNCCRVLEYVERGPGSVRSYLVLPYLAGKSLEDRLGKGHLEPADAARLVLRLAEALEHAHSRGIIHGDVKPRNVLFASGGGDEPILADFGVAFDLTTPEVRLPGRGDLVGTLTHLAPEMIDRSPGEQISPQCDVWALGVVLYQLLAGDHPFLGRTADPAVRERIRLGLESRLGRTGQDTALILDLFAAVVSTEPPPLASVPAALEAVCRRALTKSAGLRPTSGEVAGLLRAFLAADVAAEPPGPVEDVRIGFVPYGTQVPEVVSDVLYLDVGGALRAGVIDHHHLHHYPGSTTAMLPSRLHLIDAAVRRPGGPFTLYLHEHPDFDAMAAAYLARHHLAARRLPAGADALCAYADRIDAGFPGFTLSQPFTPYTAYRALLGRGGDERDAVTAGFAMLDHVLASAPRTEEELLAVDPFTAPGVFTAADRAFVTDDRARYERKMADPRCAARRVALRLMQQTEHGRAPCPGLLVRHVFDDDDEDRCLLFKDWARADGFVALCVFMRFRPTGSTALTNRAILSVTPGSNLSLRGLGGRLEAEEVRRRKELFGKDDRLTDASGKPRPDRDGFDHPDPWYDGRSHAYTIVDGPAGGSVLTADEVERLFLEFGETTDDGAA